MFRHAGIQPDKSLILRRNQQQHVTVNSHGHQSWGKLVCRIIDIVQPNQLVHINAIDQRIVSVVQIQNGQTRSLGQIHRHDQPPPDLIHEDRFCIILVHTGHNAPAFIGLGIGNYQPFAVFRHAIQRSRRGIAHGLGGSADLGHVQGQGDQPRPADLAGHFKPLRGQLYRRLRLALYRANQVAQAFRHIHNPHFGLKISHVIGGII